LGTDVALDLELPPEAALIRRRIDQPADDLVDR
jgi:hypothetical protein